MIRTCTAILSIAVVCTACAQFTLLDPTFGQGGIAPVVLSSLPGDRADDVDIQPDGRILIAGTPGAEFSHMMAVRLLGNGDLDTTFSSNGKATASFGVYSNGRVISTQPDGKVLLAGSAQFAVSFNDMAVARFTSDGRLDSTFAGNGRFTFDRPGSQDMVLSLALEPDGDILAGGKFNDQGTDMAVVRLKPDGTFDPAFADNGIFQTDEHTGEVAEDMELRPDGRITLGGGWRLTLPDADLAFLQIDTDGDVDPSFGTDGLFRPSEAGSTSVATASTLMPDGRILFAGKRFIPGFQFNEVFMGRITSDGAWDASYGSGGRSFLPLGAPYSGDVRDMVLLSNGNALLSCDVLDTASNTPAIMVMRTLPDGGFDPTFGNGGRVIVPCPGLSCSITAIAAQPDDRVVAVGTYATVEGDAVLAMRWLPELSPVGISTATMSIAPFTVFPNPSNGVLTITSAVSISGPVRIDLLDELGRCTGELHNGPWTGARTLDLPAAAAAGLYAVRISSAAGTSAVRVVLQR